MSTRPTTIPIYTLSGGVGRQAPSKRLPSESQELINALCSVERSIEKRPGTDLMGIRLSSTEYTGETLGLDPTGVYEFFWHALSDDARFLIIVDRSASDSNKNLYYVYYYNQVGDYFEDNTPEDQDQINADVRAYLTWGGESELKMVSRGENLVFLNPDVTAGYTSVYDGVGEQWVTLDLDGQPTANVDSIGAKEKYLTALRVDPAGIAVYWDSYSSYAAGTEVLVIPGTATYDTHAAGQSNGVQDAETAAGNPSTGTTEYYYILQAQEPVSANHHISHANDWTVIATNNPNWNELIQPWIALPLLDEDRKPKRIEVKDWVYPDSTTPQLGQSLPTFADLRLPPLTADVTDGNNNAEPMLQALYGLETGGLEHNSADGKV